MARKKAVQSKQGPKPVTRKIYFYRITRPEGCPALDVCDLFTRAGGVTAAKQLEVTSEDDDRHSVCAVTRPEWPVRITLKWKRMTGIPGLMDSQGSESELDLQEGQGLREQTHMVFFEDGIVGCEMNYYGPKAEHLFTHLRRFPGPAEVVNVCNPALMVLLRDGNGIDRVPPEAELTMLHLKVFRGIADALPAGLTSLTDSIIQAAKCGEPETIEVILRGARGKKAEFWTGAKEALRTLLGVPEARSLVKKADVRAHVPGVGKGFPYDLLSDRLVHVSTLVPINDRSRSLLSEAVFTAIEAGYAERAVDLRVAAGVTT